MNHNNHTCLVYEGMLRDKSLCSNSIILFGLIDRLSKKDGFCIASNKYLADIFGCSPKAIKDWLKRLEDGGYISRELEYYERSQQIKTRKIFINESYTPSTIYSRGRHQTVPRGSHQTVPRGSHQTVPDISIDIHKNSIDKNSRYKEIYKESFCLFKNEFEALYEKYPRKEGKKAAFNYFQAARNNGASFEDINKHLDTYIAYLNENHVENKFIKKASTWFENWEDEYELRNKPTKKSELTLGKDGLYRDKYGTIVI